MFLSEQKKPGKAAPHRMPEGGDTIYGRIKAPVFGKLQLFNSSNIKIEKNKIKAFRFNNEILQLKKNIIIDVPFFTKDDAYLKLIFDGKLKLYELDQFYNRELTGKLADKLNLSYSDKYFYIEKGNDLILITGFIVQEKTSRDVFGTSNFSVQNPK